MRALGRFAILSVATFFVSVGIAAAQSAAPPLPPPQQIQPQQAQPAPQPQAQPAPAQQQQRRATYSESELIDAGHKFFGSVSRELAQLIERAASRWGQPNGYVLGQEGGGAIVVGLRYGDGTLYTKNAGDRRVFWEGPSVGFDMGGEGARTMMLIYDLPSTDAIFGRFAGIDGSAYVVGGLGMTALTDRNIVVVPIRTGVGLRLGANVGYLKFTPKATWNPF